MRRPGANPAAYLNGGIEEGGMGSDDSYNARGVRTSQQDMIICALI